MKLTTAVGLIGSIVTDHISTHISTAARDSLRSTALRGFLFWRTRLDMLRGDTAALTLEVDIVKRQAAVFKAQYELLGEL